MSNNFMYVFVIATVDSSKYILYQGIINFCH